MIKLKKVPWMFFLSQLHLGVNKTACRTKAYYQH